MTSVVVITETPGLDAEGYERIVKESGRRLDELPAGCTAHLAGPAGEAWRVIAVWDSAEQAAGSGRTVLASAMQRTGFAPSRPQVFPLYSAQPRSEASLGALFTKDALFVNIAGMRMPGRDGIIAGPRWALAGPLKGSTEVVVHAQDIRQPLGRSRLQAEASQGARG